MKNPITFCFKLTRALAGSFLLCMLSVNLVAQPVTCNAHFTHNSFHSMIVNFFAGSNHSGTTYAWNFGDGDSSTQRNPLHTFAQAGAYQVCLTVTRTDAGGSVLCTASWCDSIHIALPPPPVCNAHFSHHTIWNSGRIDFDAPYNPSGSTYSWSFGDGNTASVRDTDYAYAAPGTYYACLTVTKTDTAGIVLCTDTWCDSIHAATPPPPPTPVCNAHFTHHSICHSDGGRVDFDAVHHIQGATYLWNFGDGNTATVRDTNYLYAQSGTYYVCLTVTRTDTSGAVLCTATWCDSVHVTVPAPPAPVCNAHFTHHPNWNSPSIDFDAAHNHTGATYLWNFGDGHLASVRDTDYTYAQPGTYYACLTVTRTDTAGNILCTSTWCDSVHVAPPPPPCNAHFLTFHHANNLNVHFDSAHNPSNVTFAWNFGDGDTSTARDPHHTYAAPGAYNACLTVTNTDSAGVVICTETWCDSIHIDSMHVCHHPSNCWRHAAANSKEITVNVFPNPITEQGIMHIENSVGSVTLRIFENSGRLVSETENLSNGDIQLNKKDLGPGLYFYQLSDSNGSVLKGKLMIQ